MHNSTRFAIALAIGLWGAGCGDDDDGGGSAGTAGSPPAAGQGGAGGSGAAGAGSSGAAGAGASGAAGASNAYANACALWQKIAGTLGCNVPPGVCSGKIEKPECSDEAEAWLACVEKDTTQCLCEEGDNSLNCEGSFKPDEGPAKCIAEYTAVDACTGG